MIILGFTGFLRTSEILNLQVRDILFQSDYMQLNIRCSKTDQLQHGATVNIAKIESPLCPFTFTKQFIDDTGLRNDDFLICKLRSTKRGHNVQGHLPLSYSRARNTFLSHMKRVFPDKNIGLHGLRAGGATMSAKHKVDNRLISKHGRWMTEHTRDDYIRPDIQDSLSVTQNLGL